MPAPSLASHSEWPLPVTIPEMPSVLGTLLDALAFGIVILDQRRKVIHASRTARSVFRSGIPLRLSGDVLEAGNAQETAALQKTVDRAHLGERSFMTVGALPEAIDLAVVPLAETVESCGKAIVLLERSAHSNRLTLYYFARSHHLTPAEEQLMSVLCEGVSVKEAADELGCSTNTARTHVRRVLEKTGQPSLRALTSRIARLPPMACGIG